MVTVKGGEKVFVSFRYETLPHLCFVCGRLDHLESECTIAIKCRKEGRAVPQEYGIWLQADNGKIAPSKPLGFHASSFFFFLKISSLHPPSVNLICQREALQ
ncbi:hypothetical protein REPUB_Repub05bG0107800 [Reevesia pubescens]